MLSRAVFAPKDSQFLGQTHQGASYTRDSCAAVTKGRLTGDWNVKVSGGDRQ